MMGTDVLTGKRLSGDAHLAQSIRDILMTPIGTRVMRRDYGSLLPELLDQPLGPALKLQMYAATASALKRWEPRIVLQQVAIDGGADGAAVMTLTGYRADAPEPNSLVVLTIPLPSNTSRQLN